MSNVKVTHTYVKLELSAEAFEEIKRKLTAAGYAQAFHDGGLVIDMHGLAVTPERANAEQVLDAPQLGSRWGVCSWHEPKRCQLPATHFHEVYGLVCGYHAKTIDLKHPLAERCKQIKGGLARRLK